MPIFRSVGLSVLKNLDVKWQDTCISAIINSNGFPCSRCSYYFAAAVLHLHALEKLRRLIVRKIIAAFLRCTGFIKTPVKDLLTTDNRDGHHTEISDL